MHEIINEGKNLLFHKTTAKGLNKIVRSGQIDVSSRKTTPRDFDYGDYGNVSLTRDRNWSHFNDDANAVTISISGQALQHHFDVKPFNWQSNIDPTKVASDEQEERVNKPIPFNKLYIKAVHIGYDVEELNRGLIDKIRRMGIPVHVNPSPW
jgi:hypothetical protein